jgi:hypothetical protein
MRRSSEKFGEIRGFPHRVNSQRAQEPNTQGSLLSRVMRERVRVRVVQEPKPQGHALSV